MMNRTKGFLPYFPFFIPEASEPHLLAEELLKKAEVSLPEVKLIAEGDGENWETLKNGNGYVIRGGKTGVLYGVQKLIRETWLFGSVTEGADRPFYSLRMIDHWDNMDGNVERGYAGPSLFFRNGKISWDEQTLHTYGLMLSAAGINCVCLNNVNVHFPADRLVTEEMLPELSAMADVLRIYGVRLLISIDFSMPERFGVGTADPLDENVQAWWNEQAKTVYRFIPDLIGFLVKADSEHRSGPYTYGRDHAQGANMLARALRPFGGKLIWRCFVYNCGQDWRDHSIDRPRAAYDLYAPLDGKFDDNVILQIKSGPFDFQVREGVSPLLFALPNSSKAMEIQLAQEYTGHQIDLFFMPPQWQDILDVLPADRFSFICAVSNLGDSVNWAGHDLALMNLYAYGHLAMTGRADAKKMAEESALFILKDRSKLPVLRDMLLRSSRVYEDYTSPFGLSWMVKPGVHYGVDPEGYEFDLWGTYHRANHEAVGIERGPEGTGMTQQYPAPLAEKYGSIESCPEELLLFFHRVRYDHVMKDGRTLLQRIYDNHFRGLQGVRELKAAWLTLENSVDGEVFDRVKENFVLQEKNAREWCDVINTYFYRFTGIPDEQGRKIWD